MPSEIVACLFYIKTTLLAKSLSFILPVFYQAKVIISLNVLSLSFLVPLSCEMNKGHSES